MGTLSIGKLAIQLTTPLLLRKPCKLFASVARVCQRQLGFLVVSGNRINIMQIVLVTPKALIGRACVAAAR